MDAPTNAFDVHTATGAGEATGDGRAARPREASLLDDEERAAFLAEWSSVQTGFASDPEGAVTAAERLIAALAESITRQIGEITDAVKRPGMDPAAPAPAEEVLREQLLRCREAFHLLIDS
ncbi:hypothetical protein Caci_7184 [Catenulispora acidiphila DSM 44928]|uniref:Uncharacterized protein n=1 Tax=Catenulispora acidiphila (strain DSM 44928 / JCM 14897 / NBRC 102108 / NRRL B-24433 / ID139908) TaxID=479433 RepID=C7Q700_CATAD|nr:hypothetical protein [Catenulispora acidiphila]ACU76013.1 hypothetical protein Caci_7184 [Catenulispora acidiphila DSM 44928]